MGVLIQLEQKFCECVGGKQFLAFMQRLLFSNNLYILISLSSQKDKRLVGGWICLLFCG